MNNEALRLADELVEGLRLIPDGVLHRAAAELRRLHEENLILTDSVQAKADRIDRLGEMVERLRKENQEWEKVCDQHLRYIKKLKKLLDKATGEQA